MPEGAARFCVGHEETAAVDMAESYVKKLCTTLMDAVTDRDPQVQEQICSALCALGEAQPGETLRACERYLQRHEKLAHPYRAMILKAVEAVVRSHISNLDKDMARAIILLASSEMTKAKDLVPDWQQAASSVLVAVGMRFINAVMEELLSRFQPGLLPHHFVVQTLASLAASNVFGMVPFLTSILSTMLPMLPMAKQDVTRVVFCSALRHFSESTLEYLANLDQAPDPTVRKDTFSSEIFSAYDVLFNHWLQSREAKLRLAVVEALGPMSHLLPNERLEEQLPRLIPGVLALYKKHAETFHVSKSLGQILEAAVNVGSRTLEIQLDALLAALHAQPKRQGLGSEDLPADSVRAISISTLYLISTTVDRMSDVLWPYLLEFLTPVQFTGALTPLCRSLAHLALKRQEAGADAFLSQYEASANLPSPYAITARLLVVSSDPYVGDGRGAASLRLLHVLHQRIHPLLGPRWETTIPRLVQHLDECTEETLSRKEWEEKLLMFLRDTLAVVSDNTWVSQLSLEMCKQLPCYNGMPQEKNFLYKCIGTTLGAASSKEVVRKHLQELLETARYQEEAEHEGLACCFGICAISHLDDALAQLEDFVRSDVFRKSVGILSIFKDRSESEVEKVKGTLILCYGHVAAQAPRELVLARVEADILRNMFQYFSTKVGRAPPWGHSHGPRLVTLLLSVVQVLGIKVETKDPALKLCLVQSVCMVSQAICGSAQAGAFHFSWKAELVAHMMEFIRAEPLDSLRTPLRKMAMVACTLLVSLEPPLEEQMRAEVTHGCLHSVMALLPEPEGEDASDRKALYLDTVHALEDLLTSLLHRNMTPQGLQIMVEHLNPWIKSPRSHERERALGVSACLLRYFLEHLHVSALVPFHNLGLLVGLFSPRCADLWPATRQEAVGCIYSLLYLQLGYEGFARDYRDDVAEQLLALRDSLVHPDLSVLFHTCHSIAQIIGKRLPPDQLISLLLTIFEALGDPDKNCSHAATVMINCLLKERGGVLLEKVPEIISMLRSKLQGTQEEHVLKAAQHSVYLLASQHRAAVVSSLLGSPLPFDSHTCTLWRALAVDPSLTTQVLRLLLEKMNRDVPFKESRAFLLSSTPDRVATLLPLAATCALYEVLSAPASGAAVLELYPELFVALLLRISCTVGVQLPRNLQAKERRSSGGPPAIRNLEPCSSAVDTLQAMLLRGGSEEVVWHLELEGGWELLRTSEGHEEGVTQLARAMAKHAGPRLPLVMKALISTQSSAYEIQRVTSTAFLAELLSSNVVNDLMLLESLLVNLAARQKDTCASVRRLVLRGLANLASSSPDKVRAHGPQLVTALIGGLDDADDLHSLVALEAMAGLARLLDLVEPWDLRSVLLHVAIRIRPFFDSEKVEFRRASICLFGHLSKACHGDCEDVVLEQTLSALAPLLLHLCDPQAAVVTACRFALRMCGPNLACEELTAAFQKHLQDGRGLHFGEFLNTTCKHLMLHFPDLLGRLVSTSLFYFKSSWEDVRAAAPMFTGFLVLHADRELRHQVDLEQLLAALQLLLKDPVPMVRMKAAETLGRLVKFA
ncbi:maestro heat-like repeat-containing protein family member 1 isoform X8 [Loxodonta africana]|uniref:maestro heat-like repeat-containing protein family member 1 isoform X8 n=1 Tax=Loxodonta africana TaxID=9785 RepID=UPI0030CDACB5